METTKNLWLLFCVSIFITYAPQVQSASYDPSLHWKTSESAHFIFHYDEQLRPLVLRLAPQAEEVHAKLSAALAWTPTDKTHVVLTDNTDQSNGFTSVQPSNQIILYLTPPNLPFGLEDYNDWLKMIFMHEYTHVLHLDMADGLPKHLRWLLGRYFLLFPNTFIPRWMIEGLATYMETDYQDRTGRGTSSYFQALMRMEMTRGVLDAGDVSQVMERWPSLTRWYLYGVYWYEFLAQRYGREKIVDLIKTQSSFPVPYLPDVAVWLTLDTSIISLWAEFEDFLEVKFRQQMLQLQNETWQQGQAITQHGVLHTNPVFINENEILYIHSDGISQRRLVRKNLVTGKDKTITAAYGSRFDYHPRSGVLIPQVEISKNARAYHDLYIIDIETGRQKRITHHGRYIYAAWNPDGETIAAIQLDRGKHHLVLLDKTGKKLSAISTPDDAVFNSIDWSNDGKRLLASVWRNKSYWHLEEYQFDTGQWQVLINDHDIEMFAHYDEDDNIVYSADYGQVFNIFRLDCHSGQVSQITSVTGAAYYPRLRNNKLIYSGLTPEGFDIYYQPNIEYRPWIQVTPRLTGTKNNEAPNSTSLSAETDYFALKYIQPRWWRPIYQYGPHQHDIGFATQAHDFLQWHNYALNYFYDLKNQLNLGTFAYQYNRWQPQFNIVLNRQLLVENTQLSAELSVSRIFQTVRERSQLFGGAQLRQKYLLNSGERSGASDTLIGIGFSFLNTKQFAYTPNPSQGIYTNIKTEIIEPLHADGTQYTAYMRFGARTPPLNRNIFGFNGIFGVGNDNQSPFLLLNRNNNVLIESTQFGNRAFPFHGYSAANMNGRSGNTIQYASLTWEFPISDLEFGFIFPPVGLIDLQGRLYASAGRAWDSQLELNDIQGAMNTLLNPQRGATFSKSVGMELEIESSVFFRSVCKSTLGYARGLDAFGEDQLYIGLSCI